MYIDYEAAKLRYEEAIQRYEEVISLKEEMFTRTQPNAIRYDADKVKSSNSNNMMDTYVIELEQKQIEKRIKAAKSIAENRADILRKKETALRASKEIADRVYCCRYLDRMKVREISIRIVYSEAQIYRILSIIRNELNLLREQK